MKKLIALFILLAVYGSLYAEIIVRNKDGAREYAKWRCTKTGFVAYSDQERDAYIASVSKGTSTLTTSDFANITPQKSETDAHEAKAKTTEELLADLIKRVEALEAK